MSPLFDSGSHGLRPVRNPLISGTLQQRRKKLLVESDSHNRAGPSPDRGPPRSRTRQLLKVVAGLSFVSPGLDLLIADATSVEKVLTHGNIVYETRRRVFPSTATLNSQSPPTSQTTTPPSDSSRMRLNCYQRSSFAAPQAAICQPTNLQPRLTSGFEAAPSLAEARASPSSQASTTPTPWRSSPARASQR